MRNIHYPSIILLLAMTLATAQKDDFNQSEKIPLKLESDSHIGWDSLILHDYMCSHLDCAFLDNFGINYLAEYFPTLKDLRDREFSYSISPKIPLKLHLIWPNRNDMIEELKPQDFENTLKTIEVLSNWEFNLWMVNPKLLGRTQLTLLGLGFNIRDLREALDDHIHSIVETYVENKLFAFASDMCRPFILNKEGGVYADFDFVFLNNPKDLHHMVDSYFSTDNNKHKLISNYLMGSVAGGRVISNVVNSINRLAYESKMDYISDRFFKLDAVPSAIGIMMTSGPGAVSINFFQHSNKNGSVDLVVPLPWELPPREGDEFIMKLANNQGSITIKPVGYHFNHIGWGWSCENLTSNRLVLDLSNMQKGVKIRYQNEYTGTSHSGVNKRIRLLGHYPPKTYENYFWEEVPFRDPAYSAKKFMWIGSLSPRKVKTDMKILKVLAQRGYTVVYYTSESHKFKVLDVGGYFEPLTVEETNEVNIEDFLQGDPHNLGYKHLTKFLNLAKHFDFVIYNKEHSFMQDVAFYLQKPAACISHDSVEEKDIFEFLHTKLKFLGKAYNEQTVNQQFILLKDFHNQYNQEENRFDYYYPFLDDMRKYYALDIFGSNIYSNLNIDLYSSLTEGRIKKQYISTKRYPSSFCLALSKPYQKTSQIIEAFAKHYKIKTIIISPDKYNNYSDADLQECDILIFNGDLNLFDLALEGRIPSIIFPAKLQDYKLASTIKQISIGAFPLENTKVSLHDSIRFVMENYNQLRRKIHSLRFNTDGLEEAADIIDRLSGQNILLYTMMKSFSLTSLKENSDQPIYYMSDHSMREKINSYVFKTGFLSKSLKQIEELPIENLAGQIILRSANYFKQRIFNDIIGNIGAMHKLTIASMKSISIGRLKHQKFIQAYDQVICQQHGFQDMCNTSRVMSFKNKQDEYISITAFAIMKRIADHERYLNEFKDKQLPENFLKYQLPKTGIITKKVKMAEVEHPELKFMLFYLANDINDLRMTENLLDIEYSELIKYVSKKFNFPSFDFNAVSPDVVVNSIFSNYAIHMMKILYFNKRLDISQSLRDLDIEQMRRLYIEELSYRGISHPQDVTNSRLFRDLLLDGFTLIPSGYTLKLLEEVNSGAVKLYTINALNSSIRNIVQDRDILDTYMSKLK